MLDYGEKLKNIRKSLGLTLEEAAKIAGFKNFQTLSKIENGERAIKTAELVALAKAYSFDVNFFLLDKPEPIQSVIYWRAEQKPSKAKILESKLRMYFDRYLHLQKILGFKEKGHKLFEITKQIETVNQSAKYGERYSRDLELGERPALSLSTMLEEKWNLPIFYFELPKGASAISLISDGDAVICVNSLDAPWRRNFDIAHEIFHIVYKHTPPVECGKSNNLAIERLANAFASAFLLPGDSLIKEIERRKNKGPITLNDLMILACEFEISFAALLWRLVNLDKLSRKTADKILSSPDIKEYDKHIRKNKSWDTPYISQKYLCMVFEAASRGIMTKMRAAEYLGIGVIELEEVFLNAGLKIQEKSNFEIPIA